MADEPTNSAPAPEEQAPTVHAVQPPMEDDPAIAAFHASAIDGITAD